MDISQEEWAEGIAANPDAVVANALNIDIHKGQGFIYKLEELDKTKTYYVYCRSGARSGQACKIMSELGFEKAYNLVGGILAWQGDIQ